MTANVNINVMQIAQKHGPKPLCVCGLERIKKKLLFLMNIVLEQGSPTWCPWAPSCPQGPHE